MYLIIETDIGHDPDDLFALLCLINAGVNIRAIAITQGYPAQVALARMICEETHISVPISCFVLTNKNFSNSNFNEYILKRYGYPSTSEPDSYGISCMEKAFNDYPDSELLIIGPPKTLNSYLKKYPDTIISRATMMGGFIGYDVHSLNCKRLEKFEGKTTYPSFNPGGCIDGTKRFTSANIKERRFVSKNLTHTIYYDKTKNQLFKEYPPKNRAKELFKECFDIYLKNHNGKLIHDPCAAILHLHPEIAVWVRANLYYVKNPAVEWGAKIDKNGDYFAVDIDRKQFWEILIR